MQCQGSLVVTKKEKTHTERRGHEKAETECESERLGPAGCQMRPDVTANVLFG